MSTYYEDVPEIQGDYIEYQAASSRGGYYMVDDDEGEYGDGYVDIGAGDAADDDSSVIKSRAPAELPEFLREEMRQKQLMEASKKKAFYMRYHPSELLPLVAEQGGSVEGAVEGSWNERFQVAPFSPLFPPFFFPFFFRP